MKNKHTAEASILINSSASEVWNALTDPEKVKKYFFGTEVISDWKVGSSINFKGEWEGKKYLDKGTILKLEKEKLLQFDYFSSLSESEDKPENYAVVTYDLAAEEGKVNLSVTQDNIATEEAKKHSEENWNFILNELKKFLEKK